jgi:hypothetical protein
MKVVTDNVIGKLASRRKVHEAVVAIPFKRVDGTRKFFTLPPDEVYQSVRELGYPDYKLKTEEDKRRYNQFKEFINDTETENEERFPRRSIFNMVKSMLNYNIPPQFNFLKYNQPDGKYIRPFAMYLFEFSAELSQKDLSYIWQNTTPDVGLDTHGREGADLVMESQTVSHELFTPKDILSEVGELGPSGNADALGNNQVNDNSSSIVSYEGGLDGDVQWMVFKVKQKAEASYFRKKELDRLPDGHPQKVVSVEEDLYRYGFNWPYDYFSLVELVNITATTQFKAKKPPQTVSRKSANMLRYRKGD